MSDTPIFDKVDADHNAEPDKTPKRKVMAATAGSGVGFALALIIAWILGMVGVEVPDEVENAFGVILVAVITFVSGYFTPER